MRKELSNQIKIFKIILREYNKERGTRTKITEPKTPYNDEEMEVEEDDDP
jgi:hypothetical protein